MKDFLENYVHFCHRRPDRSFFWRGKQFPMCARCTGIHLGYFSFPLFLFGLLSINLWLSLLLIIPTYLDGTIQAMSKRWESRNWIRASTGLAAGIGSMSFLSIIGKSIGTFFINLFQLT